MKRKSIGYRTMLFQRVLLISIFAFFMLLFLVSTTAIFSFDLQITHALQSLQYPLFAEFMSVVSWMGYAPQSYILVGLIVLLFYGFGLHWEAFVLLLDAVVVQVLNMLVKIIIHRPRPTTDLAHVARTLSGYSFPSGHVMFYTGFFGFIWFLTFMLLKSSWKRTFLLVIFGSLILMIGISRIYLGEHWASDVIGAYLLGNLALMGTIQYYHWGKARWLSLRSANDKNRNDDDEPSDDLNG